MNETYYHVPQPFHDLSNLRIPPNTQRTDFIPNHIDIYDMRALSLARGAKVVFKGPIRSILLYGDATIIGSIINEDGCDYKNIFVGDRVRFCDDPDGVIVEFNEADIESLIEMLPKNSVDQHLVGRFNIFHFSESAASILMNITLPEDVKDYLLAHM